MIRLLKVCDWQTGGTTDGPLSDLRESSTTIATDINDLPATSPHGSYSEHDERNLGFGTDPNATGGTATAHRDTCRNFPRDRRIFAAASVRLRKSFSDSITLAMPPIPHCPNASAVNRTKARMIDPGCLRAEFNAHRSDTVVFELNLVMLGSTFTQVVPLPSMFGDDSICFCAWNGRCRDLRRLWLPRFRSTTSP
jgi:hypothetical protein